MLVKFSFPDYIQSANSNETYKRSCDSKRKIIDTPRIRDTIFNNNEDKFQICNCNFKDQPNHIYSTQHKFIECELRSHHHLRQLNIHKYIPFPEISEITF